MQQPRSTGLLRPHASCARQATRRRTSSMDNPAGSQAALRAGRRPARPRCRLADRAAALPAGRPLRRTDRREAGCAPVRDLWRASPGSNPAAARGDPHSDVVSATEASPSHAHAAAQAAPCWRHLQPAAPARGCSPAAAAGRRRQGAKKGGGSARCRSEGSVSNTRASGSGAWRQFGLCPPPLAPHPLLAPLSISSASSPSSPPLA
jgi:hypothetical protein